MSSTLSVTVAQPNTTATPHIEEEDTWKTTTSPRITFLCFFILFGMIGNTCLIITICHSRRFRTTAFYIFIINLTVVNLCECLLNMTILMSSTIANTWTHGDIPCRLNAFFIHLVCIETLLSLTILTTDRMIAVKYREKYEHVISLARFSLLIIFSWVQSFAFSLPIAAGAVPVSVVEYINYCTVADRASVAYCAFLTILCYVSPLIVCICFFIVIVRTWYKERFAVRTLLAQNSYDENAKEEPRIRREILYSNLSATVCLSWLILEGPFVVTSVFKLFQNSVELEKISSGSLQYAWHVDLVLLFLKFSYVLVLPVAAFVWLKELRKELKDIVLCRKNNAVIDASMKKSKIVVQKLKNTGEEEKVKETHSHSKEQRVFQVPVLFATSHGVHIKKATKAYNEELDTNCHHGEILGLKCDVTGSRDNLNALGDDTSDYDSGNEMDPFSVSHPVSAKQLAKNDSLTEKHRSNSQPEVRGRSDKVKVYNNTVGSTSAGDSGLDLSTEYNSVSRSSTESAKEHSASSIIDFEIKTGTNESVKQEMKLTKTDEGEIVNVDIKQNTDINEDIIKSPAKETVVSKIGEVVDAETKPDNIIKAKILLNCIEGSSLNSIQTVEKKQKKQSDETGAVLQKRKKKKRKDKLDDTRSSNIDCASFQNLPLRPPPRLAPIGASLNASISQNSVLNRSDSNCSNQSSLLGYKNDCVRSQCSISEFDKTGNGNRAQKLCKTGSDNMIVINDERLLFNTGMCSTETFKEENKLKPGREVSNHLSVKTNLAALDCSLSVNSTVDVLTPSDCHMIEGLPVPEHNNHNVGIESPTPVMDFHENRKVDLSKNISEQIFPDSNREVTSEKEQV